MAIQVSVALSAQLILYLIAIALFVASAIIKEPRIHLSRLGIAFALAGFAVGHIPVAPAT